MNQLGDFLERAMGIELHPKFLSLTGTRCYQPLRKPIVAKKLLRQSSYRWNRVSAFDSCHPII